MRSRRRYHASPSHRWSRSYPYRPWRVLS
jgi:hypothetical protein